MNRAPHQTLGQSFTCEACGRLHTVTTKALVYADDALDQLLFLLQNDLKVKKIALVADERTFALLGSQVETLLKSQNISVQRLILTDHEDASPVCDDETKKIVTKNLSKVDLIVAVGSGVINDLSKWAADEASVPYVIVATAASMNGYASANVAASIKGVKVLVQATAPLAVFALPHMIQSAPAHLTAAGLGDVLAKPVSSADWKLNHILFDEYYCQFVVDLVAEMEPHYLNNPQGIYDQEPQAIEALFKALFYSGIAMTIAGTSAPASGGEHLLSHTLDMLAVRDGHAHDLHGRQVGVGTVLSAALFEKILAMDSIKWQALPTDSDAAFWLELSNEVQGHYESKVEKAQMVLQKLKDPQVWQRIQTELKGLVKSPQILKHCLKTAGAAHTYADVGCDDLDRFVKIWQRSHQMRARFTILDLAFMAGVLPEGARAIIEKWVVS